MSERINKLTGLGQSLWYDNIQRRLLDDGELERMIKRGTRLNDVEKKGLIEHLAADQH